MSDSEVQEGLAEDGPTPTELFFSCDVTSDVPWQAQLLSFTERLNEPYVASIQLVASDESAEPIRLLGQSCTIAFIRGRTMRQITGIVSEVGEGTPLRGGVNASIVVEPAFEALRHRINTRIFQEMTVPEILEKVLNEGLSPYNRNVEPRLIRSKYPTCTYRTQYDESDYRFCERLMEEEGIIYWFEFDGDTETLVLSDIDVKYDTIKCIHGPSLLYSEYSGGVGGHERVSELTVESQVVPTKFAARHFDWTSPSIPLEKESAEAGEGDEIPVGAAVLPVREVYQHDENSLSFEESGTVYAEDLSDQIVFRKDAKTLRARVAHGSSTVLGMKAGGIFELVGHPMPELDSKYLVFSVTHNIRAGGWGYSNVFQSISAAVPFRPARTTAKPRINSIQTATVVGPSGEEIHTDEHGRIKVQFHWDRLGTSDDHSSCWIRVMQQWAGAGWGFVFIPRIGMEVVVSFVNGDPDQPMVVGSVYNGDNPPPYSLPDEKTKSTIKTESSLGGDGFNELRFEDKAGDEEIYVHAQKDYNEEVLNDHNTTVGNDQTNTVEANQTEHIKVDQFLTVDENREKTVKKDETTTVEGTRTETVKKDETITLDAKRTVKIKKDDKVEIKGDRKLEIKGDLTEKVKGDHKNEVKGKREEKVKGKYEIKADDAFKLEDKKEIVLETGDSSITLKEDGTIEIKGKEIKITGGKSEVTMDDSETKIDAPKVGLKGKDEVKAEGKKVELN